MPQTILNMTAQQKTIKIEGQTRALSIAPNTFNEADNTIEVVFTSEAPVRMYSYALDGYFNEILDTNPSSVRSDRFDSMPVLDNHSRWGGTNDVLGRVESIRFENGQGIAKLKLTSREDRKGFIQDVKDGILRGISVGYQVNEYRLEKTGANGEIPTYRAIDWTPYEISFAPVQADANSKVRNQNEKDLNECIITSDHGVEETTINNQSTTETMGVDEIKDVTTPPVVDITAERNAAIQTERTRSIAINELVRKFELGKEFADKAISDGSTIETVNARALEAISERSKQSTPQGGAPLTGTNGAERMAKDLEDAILFRTDRSLATSDDAKRLSKMTLLRQAEYFLRAGGIGTDNLGGRELAQRVLSTGDFQNILGNVMNKKLQRSYDLAPRTWQPLVSSRTTNDFKQLTSVQLSSLPNLQKVEEGAEYQYAALKDSKEVYSIAKYGNMIGFTWEAMVNDDLNALDRLPTLQGNSLAQTQSNIVWGIVTANAAMSDGNALFSAAHGNLAGTTNAITIAALGLARAAMRKQKAPTLTVDAQVDENFLNLTPVYLVVGPDKEVEALQILAPITANLQANVNPFTSLQLIVEPRLTGTQWYLFASPSAIDTIEVANLEGNDFYTEQQMSFEKDAFLFKTRATFGAKALDWRGMYKNVGA